MIIMGVKDRIGVFMENEKFKQCFEDILDVSNDYLNVVFTSDQIWDGSEGCFSSDFTFP